MGEMLQSTNAVRLSKNDRRHDYGHPAGKNNLHHDSAARNRGAIEVADINGFSRSMSDCPEQRCTAVNAPVQTGRHR